MSELVDFGEGRKLFVEVSGQGPPLVSMHGAPVLSSLAPPLRTGSAECKSETGLGGSTNLFPIADELAQSVGRTVIRFDFEGAGQSPLSARGLSLDSYLDSVTLVLSHAGFKLDELKKDLVLYGHSMGALVAQHFAARHAGAVQAVILSCPGAPRDPSQAAAGPAKFMAPLIELARSVGTFNMATNTASRNVRARATRAELAAVRASVQLSSGEAYAQTCEAVQAAPGVELDRLDMPVLVIAGRHDVISNAANAQKLIGASLDSALVNVGDSYVTRTDGLTRSPKTVLEVVEAGHQPALEAPDKVIELVTAFLS